MQHSQLTRYGVTGVVSLLTHLIVLLVLVEWAEWPEVTASTLGFLASIGVSFSLQHRWVFQHDHAVARTLPRFLVVTTVGLALNALIMGVGTQALGFNYLLVQCLAFVAIPISNYLLNRQWTFAVTTTPSTPGNVSAIQATARQAESTPDHRLLAVLVTAFLITAFGAILHLDLARDLAISFDMLDKGHWVLVGPELAALFNLGPAWYYLLAALQSIGFGVTGTVLAVTLLAALKFPLIYRAGAHWNDRTTGLLWAALLLMPGWHSYEQIFITHPVLTGLTLAMTIVFGLRFVERGQAQALILMSLSFSLALHAHPSSLVISALPVGLYLLGILRHRFNPLALLGAFFLALLPFAPYLIDQQLSGWPLIDGLGEFQSGQAAVISLSNLLILGQQLLGGGLHYLLTYTVSLPSWLSLALTSIFVLVCLLGLSGSLFITIKGDRVALILWVALISGWIGLMALRIVHPYYMLTPLWFVMAGLVARGLAFWVDKIRMAVNGLLVFAVVSHLAFAATAIQAVQGGKWPFAFNPMMDIKQAAGTPRPHAFLSAVDSRDSGRWLCRNPGISVHGPYGLALIHSYGMEAQLTCGGADIVVGGSDSDRARVVGLPSRLLDRHADAPIAQIGSFEIHNVIDAPIAQTAIALNDFRDYPPLVPAFNPERDIVIDLDRHNSRRLAISHLGFALSRRPEVRLSCGTQTIVADGEDNTTWVFTLPDCQNGLTASISISNPDHIDVVVF